MYSQATIRRARTILRNCEAQSTPKAQRERKAVKDADAWRNRPASKAQIARIHRCEEALGYRRSTIRTIGKAGAASDLYKSLKAEMVDLGVSY